MKLRSKTTYMIIVGLIVIGLILGVLGGLGYFNKGATPAPPGTDPNKVPRSVSINDVKLDGSSLTIYFTSNACDGCSTKFTGTAILDNRLGIPIEVNAPPGTNSVSTYVTQDKIELINIEGYQFNESLKLEGEHTKFNKRIV